MEVVKQNCFYFLSPGPRSPSSLVFYHWATQNLYSTKYIFKISKSADSPPLSGRCRRDHLLWCSPQHQTLYRLISIYIYIIIHIVYRILFWSNPNFSLFCLKGQQGDSPVQYIQFWFQR